MPSSKASFAFTDRGKSSRSQAREAPIRRGRVQDTPESAVSATPANEVLNDAVSATTRKSAASAKPKPAPAATPLTPATTGFGIRVMARTMGL